MIRRTGQVAGLLIATLALCLLLLTILPGSWLARQASTIGGAWSGLTVVIEDLQFAIFSRTPAATIQGLSISATSDSAELYAKEVITSLDLFSLFKGALVLDRVYIGNAGLDVEIDEQGRSNLQTADSGGSASVASLLRSLRTTRVDDLVLDSFTMNLVNTQLKTGFSLVGEGIASTYDATKLSRGHVNGFANGQAVTADVEFGFLGDALTLPVVANSSFAFDVMASVGEDQIYLKGSVGEPAFLREVDVEFSAQISTPEHWQAFLPVALPDLPSFDVTGALTRGRENWLLQRLKGQFGSSDFSGEIRADSNSQPMLVDAGLVSEQLAMDELAPLRKIVLKLLPIKGSLDYRAEHVVSDKWPLNAIDMSIALDEHRLSVLLNQIRLRDGELDGEITRDLQTIPAVTKIRLNLKRLDLQQLLPTKNGETPRGGQLAARIELSMTGETPESIRSSVEGELESLMTGDWLDTVLEHALGVELAQSMMVDRGAAGSSGRECAFMELQAQEGIVQLRSLVFDTDTIVFLGDGEFDWKNQSIDLTIEPHYKDEKAKAISDAVYVSGELSAPLVESVHPFLTRDSAVSVLDATISSAVALVPFLNDFTEGSGSVCQGMARALGNPR